MLRWIVLGLLLLSPYGLALWSRHLAVRGGAKGAEASWFSFILRIQWIGIAFTGVWASACRDLGTHLVSGVLAGHGHGGATTLVILVGLVVPMVAFQICSALLVQGVNRSIRGAEISGREVLVESLRSFLGIGVLLLALAGAYGALTQGQWRLATALFLAGILGGVMVGSDPRRRLRFAPLAITHGELRDRLFALAARAGVRVKQLYVLPVARTRIANALAVQGESVLLTDHLLAHLSRAELDAVLAHELAHLRHRHPALLAGSQIIGGMGVWAAYMFGGSGLAGLLAFGVMIFAFMAISRRCEYVADAAALALGIRPEALITGLARVARLNHMPQNWGRALEWTLTHPSNHRRALRIASRGAVAAERVDALLNDADAPSDRYDVPRQVHEDRAFTTTFKAGVLQRNAWAMLFTNASASAAFVLLLEGSRLPGLGILGFIPAGALAFLGTFGLLQYLAMRPYRGLRSSVAGRLGSGLDGPDAPALWVGLSPGTEPRLYEGFATWDVGFLTLKSERLAYRGEETSFSLARDEIVAVDLGPRFPAWVTVRGVTVQWRRGEIEGRFTLLPIQAGGLISYAAEARGLRDHVERWRAGDAPPRAAEPPVVRRDERHVAEPRSAASPRIAPIPIAPPPTGPVTGMAPHAIHPATLSMTLFLQLVVTAGVAILMGLDGGSRGPVSILEAIAASVLAYFLLMTPLLRAGRSARPTSDREVREAA